MFAEHPPAQLTLLRMGFQHRSGFAESARSGKDGAAPTFLRGKIRAGAALDPSHGSIAGNAEPPRTTVRRPALSTIALYGRRARGMGAHRETSRPFDIPLGRLSERLNLRRRRRAAAFHVPAPAILRELLDAHMQQKGRKGDELLFGREPRLPFTQTHVQDRADEAWTAAGLERATFHLGRHFYKSALDHAGISESRADRYAGHSDGRVANRYRHLLPGQLAEDAKTLNAYLTGAATGNVIALPTGAVSGAEQPQTRMAAQGA